jgi:hypothetical protein
MVKSIKAAFNVFRKELIDISKWQYSYWIYILIVMAFIRLFVLLKEYNYSEMIDYGQKVTVLIGALAALTFSYTNTFEPSEREPVRKIGERFLKSLLYFVVGLIFSIGFRDALSKPYVHSIFPDIIVILSFIIMIILFLVGFAMLIASAVYLGFGINELTKQLSKKS